MDVKEIPVGGVNPDPNAVPGNMTMTRVMEKKEKMTSAVVLNYDILSKLMNIDFERNERPEDDPDMPF